MQRKNTKILNDPLYGFINLPGELIPIIDHPYFQRLRRIRQLGMTNLVYPGANHSRFHHALGAMHLMKQAIDTLRNKGISITYNEEIAAQAAILLHDIGHGPFSHALEDSIVKGIHHEELSLLFMNELNKHFNEQLHDAIAIFKGTYPKKFLHSLVSSQLDMDRLDYLNRDSFFTGVSEGIISSERIIKMLDLRKDELVIEAKGIYSIEKFIVSRRLMYWQVYLHKTVVSAENMLINILKRAKELVRSGKQIFCTPALKIFLATDYTITSFRDDDSLLPNFALLDDSDITTGVKVWANDSDPILSQLCTRMFTRRLFKLSMSNEPFAQEEIIETKQKIKSFFKINDNDLHYYFIAGKLSNHAYSPSDDQINIVTKQNEIIDIADATDNLSLKALSRPVEKYYICFPKEII
ncbi:MAG: hypothetical protein RIQ89_1497 [Bacteroidota bacterium]